MIFIHFRWSSVLWTRCGSYSSPFPLTAYSLIHRPGLLASDEGFEVTLFRSGMRVDPQEYDIIVYLLAEESKIARSRLYLDWLGLTGSVYHAMRRYWHEVPTLMVSLGYPYYLQDAPRVPTYVNAYGASEAIQSVVLGALMGRAPFLGQSPVDPFVGSDQARY